DFIVRTGERAVPVEIKYKRMKKPEMTRSLHNFIAAYQPDRAAVVNLSFSGRIETGKTEVYFMPFYELINNDFHI
ncbi:MAG: ATPase, partial [Deltaproteobacteria bacterium]|nr:ATPase [Deltaproteobacteria bacterium]